MTIKQVSADLLNPRGASGGDVLTYVSANARVEWSAPTSDVANTWVNANDYSTYTTLTANIYNTYAFLNANLGGTVTSPRFNTAANSNTFTLSQSVADANAILVTLSGVVQVPIDAYIVSSTTLTLNNTSPLISNLRLEVRYL